jgi:hypothetical protein
MFGWKSVWQQARQRAKTYCDAQDVLKIKKEVDAPILTREEMDARHEVKKPLSGWEKIAVRQERIRRLVSPQARAQFGAQLSHRRIGTKVAMRVPFGR